MCKSVTRLSSEPSQPARWSINVNQDSRSNDGQKAAPGLLSECSDYRVEAALPSSNIFNSANSVGMAGVIVEPLGISIAIVYARA